MVNKILLIGAINKHNLPLGGEEYKNQLFVGILSEPYSLYTIDTYKWQRRPSVTLRLLFNLFFRQWDRIIISASSKSVYQLIRVIQYFSNISKKTIYFVVGGYFPEAVKSGTFQIKPYNTLAALVVQSDTMRSTLSQAGFNGCVHVLPNFKKYTPQLLKTSFSNKEVKFLFISRVHPDKGVMQIFEANNLLKNWGFRDFTISFYGPVEQLFADTFISMLDSNMNYNGVLDIINNTDKAYSILSSFDVMLFPTFWKGEGFPGVLLDAFIAGLPVIATDWNINRELIKNNENGLLIPPKNAVQLALAMRKLIEDPMLRKSMAARSKECANQFHVDIIGPTLIKIIENPEQPT